MIEQEVVKKSVHETAHMKHEAVMNEKVVMEKGIEGKIVHRDAKHQGVVYSDH